jgi:hypothetical protein
VPSKVAGRGDRRQIGALHIGHGEVQRPANLAEVVDPDDVRVSDLARELQLALESLLELPASESTSVAAIVAPSANPGGYGV